MTNKTENLYLKIENYLPELFGINKGLRNQRSVYDGYQRGWGLEFGGLRERILSDPLYIDAYEIAKDRTIMSERNRMNIFLLLRFYLSKVPAGNIIEFGSFRGGSAIFMAYICKQLFPEVNIYALDSYEGMPLTDKNVDAHNLGDFKNTNFEEFQYRIDELDLDNLIPVKGLFEDTSEKVLTLAKNISLAHIDCDIGPAVRYSYEKVKSFMVDGGYLVFDDATVSSCIGATEVVEDLLVRRDGMNSEQIWPHYVFRIFKSAIN